MRNLDLVSGLMVAGLFAAAPALADPTTGQTLPSWQSGNSAMQSPANPGANSGSIQLAQESGGSGTEHCGIRANAKTDPNCATRNNAPANQGADGNQK